MRPHPRACRVSLPAWNGHREAGARFRSEPHALSSLQDTQGCPVPDSPRAKLDARYASPVCSDGVASRFAPPNPPVGERLFTACLQSVTSRHDSTTDSDDRGRT